MLGDMTLSDWVSSQSGQGLDRLDSTYTRWLATSQCVCSGDRFPPSLRSSVALSVCVVVQLGTSMRSQMGFATGLLLPVAQTLVGL